MKRAAFALVPLMLAGAALAADLPMVEDADASGNWSMAELQAAWDAGVLKPVEG